MYDPTHRTKNKEVRWMGHSFNRARGFNSCELFGEGEGAFDGEVSGNDGHAGVGLAAAYRDAV